MSEPVSKQALLFGAGNIGRGFIGVLLSQAGYSVTFVDVVEPLIELINRHGRYTVTEVTPTGKKKISVEQVKAINGNAEADVVEEISRATLVTTAVGPGILPVIAPVIAKGLQRRADLNLKSPVNIIACENLIDNSMILKGYVLSSLPPDYHPVIENQVGFPCCVVDKVVTVPGEQEQQVDPLAVVAEGHGLLIVDRGGFVGNPPVIQGMKLTDNLDAYVEQKIFTLNTAHAVTAYLGYLKGHEFIHEALEDPAIRPIVLGVIGECSAVLVKRRNLDPKAQQQYADSILKRFENKTLPDPVVRVAREPRRKLAPNDRLIKPALLAVEAGITPTHLATGIAAALLYNNPDDEQAVAIGRGLKEKGLEKVLQEICGLTGSILANLVRDKMLDLKTWQSSG